MITMALECTRSYYANRGNRKAFFMKRLHIQEKVSFPSQWMQHAFVSRFLVMIVGVLRITGFNPHFDQQEWNDFQESWPNFALFIKGGQELESNYTPFYSMVKCLPNIFYRVLYLYVFVLSADMVKNNTYHNAYKGQENTEPGSLKINIKLGHLYQMFFPKTFHPPQFKESSRQLVKKVEIALFETEQKAMDEDGTYKRDVNEDTTDSTNEDDDEVNEDDDEVNENHIKEGNMRGKSTNMKRRGGQTTPTMTYDKEKANIMSKIDSNKFIFETPKTKKQAIQYLYYYSQLTHSPQKQELLDKVFFEITSTGTFNRNIKDKYNKAITFGV